ncbi:MAG: hypothetical protein QOD39_1169 [Mycobacterium sp.]|jgi:uncharacterized SAM-binding protein YcdF (DUF218 family)|nr:hypothetical protein [Mycobacterium sp.]
MALSDIRRAVVIAAAILFTLAVLMGITGVALFTNAKVDPLQRADAVVVLGGEHDGREDYGIELARSGWAPTVVISDAYPKDDEVMHRVCKPVPGIEVICARASELTTRGEAQMMHQLAEQRSWTKIIVVTWRYHMPRARLVFRQCFSPNSDAVVMAAVPRQYDYSPARWQFIYAYQYAAFAKAEARGNCTPDSGDPSSRADD